MPGLLRGVARTAVIAGTATAVSGRVQRRQARRCGEQDAHPPTATGPRRPSWRRRSRRPDPLDQLERLGKLKAQGVLTEEEFAAEKAKILGRRAGRRRVVRRVVNMVGVWTSQKPSDDREMLPRFTRAGMVGVPKDRMPDGEMLPETAYQIVQDEVMLDGNARFNLATFVTTWMDEEADRLYAATFDKNMIDKDEYPQTAEIEARCVRMLADLWNAPDAADSVGTSTTGSSEGCMLGGLALKRRWQQRAGARRASRPTGPTSSWAPTSRWCGRSSPTTGRSSRATCRWRATSST